MAESDGSESLDLLTGDDKIVAEAKKRFRRCEQWEEECRARFVDDLKFANADADNGYQWPNKIQTEREVAARPCLTINKTRQHNLQIINDAKQNKPSVNIRPTGGGATYDAAQVFEGIVRHIEYISNAESAYDTATTFQVQGGIGYVRLVTDYASDDSFDQEIFIRRVRDPLSIYLDPDIQEADGSDARFGFVFDDMPKDEFQREYPDDKDIGSTAPLGNTDGWMDSDHIRVAEYFRLSAKRDKLIVMKDPQTGEETTLRASTIPSEIRKLVMADPETRSRDITSNVVEWYKIAGDKIIDRKVGKDAWPGKYIPIARLIGEETVIEGNLDRKGHTRALIDPQRMYNYASSSAVEAIALQAKSPWVAAAASIEGYETYWETANNVPHSVLPYNGTNDSGEPNPPPQRSEPPVFPAGYVQWMETANNDMMFVSGQYQSQMGEPSNERSGKAIAERQRQGDNATYHYIDNLGMMIRHVGKMLIDLIPKVYDTPRVIRILGEDGSESEVTVDPQAKLAYEEKRTRQEEAAEAIFNPKVGQYDVEADVGPGYATKRQEAWNAFTQIAAQNPELMGVIGDLMFQNADFPGADEIAERLERMVPAQAKGEGENPALAQAQAQMQGMTKTMQDLVQQLAEERLKLKAKELDLKDKTEQKAIDWEYAITDRLKVLLPTILNPRDIAQMVHDLAMQEHASNRAMLETAHSADVDAMTQDDEPEEPVAPSDQAEPSQPGAPA